MQVVVVARTPRFTLTSYGNGLAYTLEKQGCTESVYVQGDDATQFREEYAALETVKDTTDTSLGELWHQYGPEIHVRCNACLAVMQEWEGHTITACVRCGRDDALMQPFTPHAQDQLITKDRP